MIRPKVFCVHICPLGERYLEWHILLLLILTYSVADLGLHWRFKASCDVIYGKSYYTGAVFSMS